MEQNQNPESPARPSGEPGDAAADTRLYYRDGSPMAPTHPDHGPMHLLPRQEDGGFSAYYYCSKAELEAAQVDRPPPRRHRRDGFSADRQETFLEALRDTASFTDAARIVGISRTTAYNLYNSADAGAFRAAVDAALKGVDIVLETTALERAVNGQEEIVYHRGQRVGVRWKYDNKLLMFLMRARNPLKYAPLSEIQGWLRQRGVELPPDLSRSLDRVVAAEEEWGRRLPGVAPPALAAAEEASPTRTEVDEPEHPVIAPTSSTSPENERAIASTSSTSGGEAVPDAPAAVSSPPPAEAAGPPARPDYPVYRPPPIPRFQVL